MTSALPPRAPAPVAPRPSDRTESPRRRKLPPSRRPSPGGGLRRRSPRTLAAASCIASTRSTRTWIVSLSLATGAIHRARHRLVRARSVRIPPARAVRVRLVRGVEPLPGSPGGHRAARSLPATAPWPAVDRPDHRQHLRRVRHRRLACTQGWRYQFVTDLFNELLEHDPHARGVIRRRLARLAGAKIEVRPAALPTSASASDKELAKTIACEVDWQIQSMPGRAQFALRARGRSTASPAGDRAGQGGQLARAQAPLHPHVRLNLRDTWDVTGPWSRGSSARIGNSATRAGRTACGARTSRGSSCCIRRSSPPTT